MKLILSVCDEEGKEIYRSILLETGVVDVFGNVFSEEALESIVKQFSERPFSMSHNADVTE